MLVLAGCVQPVLAPSVNAAAARVLDRVGVSLLEARGAGCCGAVRFHLNDQEGGRDDMRALIDAWWPSVERGEVEAIVMTASGCGSTVREYAHFLAADPAYGEKAARIAAMTRDLSEVIAAEAEALGEQLGDGRAARRGSRSSRRARCSTGSRFAAWSSRCSRAPATSSRRWPSRTCAAARRGPTRSCSRSCRSQLRARKLGALQAGVPAQIATANVGCLAHLQAGTETPVRHWIELVDEALQRTIPA